jgi:hypothetical protein
MPGTLIAGRLDALDLVVYHLAIHCSSKKLQKLQTGLSYGKRVWKCKYLDR